ncbi:YheC/YheD family protein [Brevibacillus sp. B_LB10_24]|uniref:YheC/YheD family endospore coat-associated protein n=1 Tax=Brevibacillus sp. B_LB10_24 TaxID=3380645 RepID=UPI0038BAEBB1
MGNMLGIMTHRVTKPERFEPFFHVAAQEGFGGIIVFTPHDADLQKETIAGWIRDKGRWKRKDVPFPLISHDVGYYRKPETIQKVKALKRQEKMPFIGYGLGSKWSIHKALLNIPVLQPHLPETVRYREKTDVVNMLKKHETVMLKPLNGLGGEGIYRLSSGGDGYLLEGGGEPMRRCTRRAIGKALHAICRNGKYIVQQWLDIRSQEGRVYDIRSLMQKGRQGEWQLMGFCVREGGAGKFTSNLSGGGSAHQVFPYLEKNYGPERAGEIEQKLREISSRVCTGLEEVKCKRLVELGLDLGVDRDGHIWIIEVNIKPGKTQGRDIYQLKTAEDRIRLPIQFASGLIKGLPAGR